MALQSKRNLGGAPRQERGVLRWPKNDIFNAFVICHERIGLPPLFLDHLFTNQDVLIRNRPQPESELRTKKAFNYKDRMFNGHPHSKRHETHQIPHPCSHTHPQMSWALSALSSARNLPVHPRTFHSLPHPCSSTLKIPLEKTLEYNSCSALYSCDHLPWLASLTALGCSPVVILYRLIGSAYGC